MTDERTARRENPPASAMPCVQTPPAPAGEGVDTATLAHNIATLHQRRALLTAYIREHLQEGIDYYTLTLGGKVAKPSLSKAGSEKFVQLFQVVFAHAGNNEIPWTRGDLYDAGGVRAGHGGPPGQAGPASPAS